MNAYFLGIKKNKTLTIDYARKKNSNAFTLQKILNRMTQRVTET